MPIGFLKFLRLRVRTLMLLVAVAALGIVAWRVWDEGLNTHWTLLKLRFGDIETRRATAKSLHEDMAATMFADLFGGMLGSTATPAQQLESWQRRQRRARLILPALLKASRDPDNEYRRHAIDALGVLMGWYRASEFNEQARGAIVEATRDPDPLVRIAALGAITSLVLNGFDHGEAMRIVTRAIDDSANDVRLKALHEVLFMGMITEPSLPEVISVCIRTIETSGEPSMRERALSWLGLLEKKRRDLANPPDIDILPAVFAALGDPEPEARRRAARVFSEQYYAQNRSSALWAQHKDRVAPVLLAARYDAEEGVRFYAALGLYELGNRDRDVLDDIESAARSGETKLWYWRDFASARARWHCERLAMSAMFALSLH